MSFLLPPQEYMEEVKRFIKDTSSGPSYTTPVIVKTKSIETKIRDIERLCFNFPWCNGYSPKRYHHSLYLLIHKDS